MTKEELLTIPHNVPYLIEYNCPYSSKKYEYELIVLSDKLHIVRDMEKEPIWHEISLFPVFLYNCNILDSAVSEDFPEYPNPGLEAKACICPLYGSNGLLAIGCSCGGK